MEAVGRKRPRRERREFTPEFKAEIVGLCRRGDRSIPQVVAGFDLIDSAVRRWIARADAVDRAQVEVQATVEAGGSAAARLSERERAELMELRRENKRLKEDNDILKRATAFFARETR